MPPPSRLSIRNLCMWLSLFHAFVIASVVAFARRVLSSPLPLACHQPRFVVPEPERKPRENGRGDEFLGRPFLPPRSVEARLIIVVRVWDHLVRITTSKSWFLNPDLRRPPFLVFEPHTIAGVEESRLDVSATNQRVSSDPTVETRMEEFHPGRLLPHVEPARVKPGWFSGHRTCWAARAEYSASRRRCRPGCRHNGSGFPHGPGSRARSARPRPSW